MTSEPKTNIKNRSRIFYSRICICGKAEREQDKGFTEPRKIKRIDTMKKLDGKIAIITGGSGTIGFTTAKKLAEQGAKIMLVDIDEDTLREKVDEAISDGFEMSYHVADVTDANDAKSYVDKTIEKYGKFELFFNNAGIEGELSPVEEYPEDEFDKVIAVNLKGVFLGMKYAIPKIEDGGSIVITSSIAGLMGIEEMVAYTTSKHAVIGIMRTAALEVADRKVRVNTVHPGYVDSPMMREVEEGMDADNGGDIQEDLEQSVPLKRYAEPEDVANMVTFLFSDDSSYSTGSQFVTDGGVVG